MSGTGGKDDDNKKLEVFDGSEPATYKRWRRRAELHLRALPLTFSTERWGPKLLEYVGRRRRSCSRTCPLKS